MRDRKRPSVRLSVLATAGFLAAGVVAAGCGSGGSEVAGSGGAAPTGTPSAGAATRSHGAVAVTTANTRFGTILVDAAGRTLYLFEKDRPDRSECSGACAVDWPVFHSSTTPKAGTGVNAAMLGTIKRSERTRQVTYNHHPLYYYSDDAGRPGEIRGQNVNAFGARWYVVAPTGNKIEGGGS
jgi:predicted lipoprotein with Yx(FWY)xxD motif